MLKTTTWLLFTLLCVGCFDAKKAQLAAAAQRAAAVQNLKEIGLALHAKHAAVSFSAELATHEFTADTDYFAKSPQKDQTADGTFTAGTSVRIITDGEKHVVVRSTDGVEGYVASDSIKLLTGDNSEVKK